MHSLDVVGGDADGIMDATKIMNKPRVRNGQTHTLQKKQKLTNRNEHIMGADYVGSLILVEEVSFVVEENYGRMNIVRNIPCVRLSDINKYASFLFNEHQDPKPI